MMIRKNNLAMRESNDNIDHIEYSNYSNKRRI